MDGVPIWLFLVAPPGCTKSALLMSFLNANKIMATTTLTSASLISGMNNKHGIDNSLIPQLNNKVLVIKDFTTILNMNPIARDEIFGIFRDVYDGVIDKYFATIEKHYKSKFGIIAGVTPAIEVYTDSFSAMGERFLTWKINLPKDSTIILKKAIENTTKETEFSKELNEIAKLFLRQNFIDIPIFNDKFIDKIINLAQLMSIMRASVIRERYSKEITHQPIIELATRIVKQLVKISIGIAQFKNKKITDEEEYKIIKKLALHSMPSRYEDILRYSYLHKDNFDIKFLIEKTKLPSITIQRLLENLTLIRVLERNKINMFKSTWKLSNKIKKYIEITEVYK
jgi:hypothetical protein